MDKEAAYREELLVRIMDFVGAPDAARLTEAEADARWERIRAEVWANYFPGSPPPPPPPRRRSGLEKSGGPATLRLWGNGPGF
jgi:hypothetical protein